MPRILQTICYARRPNEFVERCLRRIGSVVRVRIIGKPDFVFIGDPGTAVDFLSSDTGGMLVGEPRRGFLEPVVGTASIMCMDGDEWVRNRRMLGSAFQARHARENSEMIAAIVGTTVSRLTVGNPLELRPVMQDIALEVMLRVVFGIADEDRLTELRSLVPELAGQAATPASLSALSPRLWRALERSFLARSRTNPIGRFVRTRARVDRVLYAEIDDRLAGAADGRNDILSALVTGRSPDGPRLSRSELRDALLTLLEAGHETTANTAAWAFERLARHPRIQRRVRAAVDRGDDEYVDACVREILRIRPIISVMPRIVTEDVEVGGHRVTAGSWVAPSVTTLHAHPGTFPEPGRMCPERFADGVPVPASWLPFGIGRRRCLGAQFAMLELREILRGVLSRFEVDIVPGEAGDEPPLDRPVILIPARGARVVLRHRDDAVTAGAGRPTP